MDCQRLHVLFPKDMVKVHVCAAAHNSVGLIAFPIILCVKDRLGNRKRRRVCVSVCVCVCVYVGG